MKAPAIDELDDALIEDTDESADVIDADDTPVELATRKRREPIPPGGSLLDWILKNNLDGKLINAAMTQTKTPYSLEPEVRQEVFLMWSQMVPDTERYSFSEVASYAHRSARHAALRMRRELGSPVRLPGSAFRKKNDGTSYVSPGILSRPLSWEAMDGWYGDEGSSSGDGAAELDPDCLIEAAASMHDVAELLESGEAAGTLPESVQHELILALQQQYEGRLLKLDNMREILSERQSKAIQYLLDGKSLSDIEDLLDVRRSTLVRELNNVVRSLTQDR